MISNRFCRCLAKICGDGNLHGRTVRYNNTCDELLNEFEEDMLKEFGRIHLTKGISNSGTKYIQTNTQKIANRFTSYLDNFNSTEIYIPKAIKNSNKQNIIHFIRALYDDEGCVALRIFKKTKEWKRNITLTSNSFKLLDEIKQIFIIKFGIQTNKIIRNRSNSEYDKSFVLSITGKENIIKFSEIIKFKHPKKRKLIALMVKSYEATSKNKLQYKKIRNELIFRSLSKKG